MNIDNELLNNLDKLHTTELGVERIKRNLSLNTEDVVDWCKTKTNSANAVITRNGKNWYVKVDNYIITINAYSYTIITAHKEKRNGKLFYFCSIPKRNIVPDSFIYKEIQAYKYLVVEHTGSMNKIQIYRDNLNYFNQNILGSGTTKTPLLFHWQN